MAESDESRGLGCSMRDFLKTVREPDGRDIQEVDEEIEILFETTAVYRALEKRNPVILFNNIRGFPDYRIVTNVLGSRNRMALAAGSGTMESVLEKWHGIVNGNDLLPDASLVSRAPVKEIVHTGKDVNILDIPAPWHYVEDGSRTNKGRYITSGLAVTRDRESGIYNLSYSRMQLIDRNTYAFDVGSHGHFWKSVNDATESGEKLQISVIIGAHPALYILAASFTDNEYAKAARVISTSFTRGVKNSLQVPANAEIVLEAELAEGEVYDEGPFAEYTGYLGMDSTRNLAKVKSVMRRHDPIFYDIQPSNSHEHVNLFSIPRSSVIMDTLRNSLPKGFNYSVEWPTYAARFLALAQIGNARSGIEKQLGLSLMALDPLWAKIVSVTRGRSGLTLIEALVNIAYSLSANRFSSILIRDNYIISSDPVIRESGTNDKIILISDEYTGKVSDSIEGDIRTIMLKGSSVVISHAPVENATVNVVVPWHTDIADETEVGWAVATRTRPGDDIVTGGKKITIKADRKALATPTIPGTAMERAKEIVGKLD